MRKASRYCLLGLLLSGAGVAAATVGPDAFGYTASDQAAYSFVDISRTGIRTLAGVDDGTTPAGIGFAFRFYGQDYATACISANGFLTFGGCEDAFANQDLSATPTPGNLPLIAAHWADLTFLHANADAVYYQTLGAAPNRQFVVQWNSAFPQNAAQPITFQAILVETSNEIRLQYQKLDVGAGDRRSNGGSATVGICNAGGRASAQCLPWSYNAAVLRANMAILFAASRPTSPTITWPAPADIIVGTALGPAQLNATASVPGQFVYTPPAGTVLALGLQQTLSVTFTPADAVRYTTASASVKIDVLTRSQATARLEATVRASGIDSTVQKDLLATLDAAVAAFDRGNNAAAVNQLQAFQNKVRAQAGKKIAQAAADALVAAAQRIIG